MSILNGVVVVVSIFIEFWGEIDLIFLQKCYNFCVGIQGDVLFNKGVTHTTERLQTFTFVFDVWVLSKTTKFSAYNRIPHL